MRINYGIKAVTIIGMLAGILILSGCSRQASQGGMPQGGPPEVAVVTVQPKQVVITTELTGRTSANLMAEVRPQVNGIIQKRLFTEGADVKAGQVLYQIDPAPFEAVLDNANASFARAQANLPAIRSRVDRFRELLTIKAVSQQDFDDAAAALKQAEADIEYWKAMVRTARISLNYTKVTAPISGRIGRSNVTEGALVTANQSSALASIQKLDPMYVDVPQSTSELLRLRRNLAAGDLNHDGKIQNRVTLVLEDGTKYSAEGALQFRDVSVDPTTGSVILRVVFPNPQGVLLPGMFVRALVEEGFNKKALLVPQQAVSRDVKGNPLTLVVGSDNKVQMRMLKVDRPIGDSWLVSSGLAPGERVIVEGTQKIKPGIPVQAVPYAPAGTKTGIEKKKAPPTPAKSK